MVSSSYQSLPTVNTWLLLAKIIKESIANVMYEHDHCLEYTQHISWVREAEAITAAINILLQLDHPLQLQLLYMYKYCNASINQANW